MCKRTDVCTFSAVQRKTEKIRNEMTDVNLQAILYRISLICLTLLVVICNNA